MTLNRREFLKGSAAVAATGLGAWTLPIGCRSSVRRDPSTIVLITLDTTRVDHLGCYGYARPTTPSLDRLAERSVVYDRAIAPGTWTLPSHASLFTGKFPTSHGARYDPEGSFRLSAAIKDNPRFDRFRARSLALEETTLAELLRSAGYLTGAVIAGPWLNRFFRLNEGFDHYDDNNTNSYNGRAAGEVTDGALSWLEATAGSPRFLFVNYFDPHSPYAPPEEFARRFVPASEPLPTHPGQYSSRVQAVGLYDAEICYMDRHFGRLIEGLRELGLYDGAWIIITSDHGELLGEHGERSHGDTPYQEVVHVPLVVKEPGAPTPRRSDQWIQLTEIMPMILARLEMPLPPEIQGSVPPSIDHPIVVESQTLPELMENGSWLALIDDQGMKFIWNSQGRHKLFDLMQDPREQRDLVAQLPDRARTMQETATRYLAGLPRPGEQITDQVIDPETEKALESLGYVK